MSQVLAALSAFMEDMSHPQSVALVKWLSQAAKKAGIDQHVYVVGGAVRNFVIRQPIKDIDVTIDVEALKGKKVHDSKTFAEFLAKQIPAPTNLTVNQYGVAILTIKGKWDLDGHPMKGEVIEIANTRTEKYGGSSGKGYKPSEISPANIDQDILRREFTFNTLLWRLADLAKGPDRAEILDLTGRGMRDLAAKRIQTPIDPDQTFADDPTRMLRAIKFAVKYGMKIPPDMVVAIRRNAHKLDEPPAQAIVDLLGGYVLNQGPNTRKILSYMVKLGLTQQIAQRAHKEKLFASILAGKLKGKDARTLLHILGLGIPVKTDLNFLSPAEQAQLRRATARWNSADLAQFVGLLKSPPIDNRALISKFGLKHRQAARPVQVARQLLLADPRLRATIEELRRRVEQSLAQEFSVQENDMNDHFIRELLRMSTPKALGGRGTFSVPKEWENGLSGDAAQEALQREKLIMEMRKQDSRSHDPRYVSLDLMEMGDVVTKDGIDKFLGDARSVLIKRSKGTRAACCKRIARLLQIGGVQDQGTGPAGGEYANEIGARDKGKSDPIGGDVKAEMVEMLDHPEIHAAYHEAAKAAKKHGANSPQFKEARAKARKVVQKFNPNAKWGNEDVEILHFIAEEFELTEHDFDCPVANALYEKRDLDPSMLGYTGGPQFRAHVGDPKDKKRPYWKGKGVQKEDEEKAGRMTRQFLKDNPGTGPKAAKKVHRVHRMMAAGKADPARMLAREYQRSDVKIDGEVVDEGGWGKFMRGVKSKARKGELGSYLASPEGKAQRAKASHGRDHDERLARRGFKIGPMDDMSYDGEFVSETHEALAGFMEATWSKPGKVSGHAVYSTPVRHRPGNESKGLPPQNASARADDKADPLQGLPTGKQVEDTDLPPMFRGGKGPSTHLKTLRSKRGSEIGGKAYKLQQRREMTGTPTIKGWSPGRHFAQGGQAAADDWERKAEKSSAWLKKRNMDDTGEHANISETAAAVFDFMESFPHISSVGPTNWNDHPVGQAPERRGDNKGLGQRTGLSIQKGRPVKPGNPIGAAKNMGHGAQHEEDERPFDLGGLEEAGGKKIARMMRQQPDPRTRMKNPEWLKTQAKVMHSLARRASERGMPGTGNTAKVEKQPVRVTRSKMWKDRRAVTLRAEPTVGELDKPEATYKSGSPLGRRKGGGLKGFLKKTKDLETQKSDMDYDGEVVDEGNRAMRRAKREAGFHDPREKKIRGLKRAIDAKRQQIDYGSAYETGMTRKAQRREAPAYKRAQVATKGGTEGDYYSAVERDPQWRAARTRRETERARRKAKATGKPHHVEIPKHDIPQATPGKPPEKHWHPGTKTQTFSGKGTAMGRRKGSRKKFFQTTDTGEHANVIEGFGFLEAMNHTSSVGQIQSPTVYTDRIKNRAAGENWGRPLVNKKGRGVKPGDPIGEDDVEEGVIGGIPHASKKKQSWSRTIPGVTLPIVKTMDMGPEGQQRRMIHQATRGRATKFARRMAADPMDTRRGETPSFKKIM